MDPVKLRVLLISSVFATIGAAAFYFGQVDGWLAMLAGVALLFGFLGIGLTFAPQQLITIFAIPELRKKIFITLMFLMVYRVGYYIPLPMIDQELMQQKMSQIAGGALGKVFGFVSLFSGGNLSTACIFALGIMPYISASIIVQLLSSGVVPSLERLRKEGESGRKRINEITRWLTVPICLIQSLMFVQALMRPESADGYGLAQQGYVSDTFHALYFGFSAVLIMTTGTIFLMWIGEQIDEYGIGNGISLIIMAGIIARIPEATGMLFFEPGTTQLKTSLFTLGSETGDISLERLLVLIALFIGVVVGVIAITKAQRRIPTQSQRHVRGRRAFGGTRQFLPMKVNAAGVMPVIFASTLLMLPGFFFNIIASLNPDALWAGSLASMFMGGRGWFYNFCYIILIYLFCYFWVAITFNPKEIADNLKDYGSFIPGYRPGKSTADYLEKVLLRITYVGAAFLAIVAIIPSMVATYLEIPYQIAAFYGGTGLLIVVSVALDLVQKINSHLVMRNYPGLTEE
jgi:preprotein translocase subunit SecY